MTRNSKNILVLVDPHKSSHDVLLRARQLAVTQDVVLHLIHVITHACSTGLRYRLNKERRDLQRLAKLYDLPVATIKVRVGNIAQVLAEEASLLCAEVLREQVKEKKLFASIAAHAQVVGA